MSEKKLASAETPPVPVAAQPAQPVMVLTAADAARQRELDALLRLQAKQDVARAASGTVEMIALVGFTMVTDDAPDGEEIKPGQRFTIPGFDVPAFLGKARLASEEVEPARGAAVT